MSIIAVMNRKGGSGKSTLATHIAAWRASTGGCVMLGNTDTQRSTQAWLGRRSPAAAAISNWPSDFGKTFRPVQGVTQVVDTAGGIQGLELAKHLARVDAIVMPVGPSVFDFETSVEFFRELYQHPRVASGRCRVAVVGMRWPMEIAKVWEFHGVPKPLPFLTIIPEDPIYRSCLESGSTVFDDEAPSECQLPWLPLLDWLEHLPKGDGIGAGADGVVHSIVECHVPHGPHSDHAASETRTVGSPQLPLHSAESFIETRPPAGVCAADLKLAGVPDSGGDSVRLEPSPIQASPASFKAIGHNPQYEISLMPALKAHPGGGGSSRGWLARLFKCR